MFQKYDFAPYIWDTGNDHLDRNARTWRDPTGIQLHFNALLGNTNSLPDSTIDPSATSQFTSAFAFHKAGEPVEDIVLPFALNGHSVQSISTESLALTEGTHYSVSGEDIVLSSSFLGQYFATESTYGVMATLTVAFSEGPNIPIQLVQWGVPTLPVSSAEISSATNIDVVVNWNSIGKPATMAAFKSDGTPLLDEWTVGSPPLQQGRTTFGGAWNWNCESTWPSSEYLRLQPDEFANRNRGSNGHHSARECSFGRTPGWFDSDLDDGVLSQGARKSCEFHATRMMVQKVDIFSHNFSLLQIAREIDGRL